MNKYDLLNKYFGYKSFRDNQEEIIDNIVDKKDVIAVLPTGGGKSIIFQIAGLLLEDKVIIITPLIALMKDQVNNLNSHGISACYICSDNKKDIKNIYKYKFIYLTGEMFINMKLNINISLIVVDEAHTLFWGYDFRYQLLNIGKKIKELKVKPIIAAFTATLPKAKIKYINNILNIKNPYINYNLPIKDNLTYITIKNHFMSNLLYILDKYERVIIYTVTIKTTEYLYNLLHKKYKIGIYHSKLNEKDKALNQEYFSKGLYKVIVCTNAFGMGIDIRDIRAVVLYELPLTLNDLVQQLGRAGRDGAKCFGFIFYNKDLIKNLFYFIENNKYYQNKSKEVKKVIEFTLSKDKKKFIKKYYNTLDF